MPYTIPQVQVFQEFVAAPAALVNPLRAFVVGPHYFLVRYADGEGRLGQYDPDNDTAYAWPNRPAGAVVDESFTVVTVENALLKYYTNLSGDAADEIKGVHGYNNRIRAEAVNFADNGDDYPRATSLPDRDVQVGDYARVYANIDGTVHELISRIVGMVADVMPSEIGSVTADSGNSGSLSEGCDAAANEGVGAGTNSIAAQTSVGYDGLADGYPQETYTLEITTASSGGVGAIAQVSSASGTDDESDVAITASGQVIGSRGFTFDWTTAGDGEWRVGDKFVVTVRQEYAPVTVTPGGSFDSDDDTTYIVEVTKGGRFGEARISISTNNGLDVSGPHTVSNGVAIAVGTKGVTLTITGDEFDHIFSEDSSSSLLRLGAGGFVKGERWYLPCTGRTEAGYKTLVLADDLPVALRAASGWELGSSSSAIYASDLNLELLVQQTITLPRENFTNPPDVNWAQSETQITLKAGAALYDSGFVDADGDLVPLLLTADVGGLYSTVYVTYRALLQTFVSDIQTISDASSVADVLGEISVDNPLALGVYYALLNSNGTEVKYMGVPTNDIDGYSVVLDKATGRRDLYTFVPMTKDREILALIESHVDAQSTETRGKWRIAFFNGESSSLLARIDAGETYPDGGTSEYEAADLLATVLDDPNSSGTQYTLVTWDSDAYPNGGGFVDMGVRAGDIFRTNYRGDGFGGAAYDDYIVDAVLSNQQLRLLSGLSKKISVASKFSVHRSLTRSEEAATYAKNAGRYSNRRVYFVWPDVIEDAAGVQIPGFYACAAIAGLISGVVPQQGLTNLELNGFSEVSRTTDYFSESQLNTMAEAGIWIIDRDPDTGAIFNRHELSTDNTDLKKKELMVVKNVDSMSYTFLIQLAPLIGVSNVTPRALAQIRRQISGTIDFLIANGATPTLGGQLIAAEIVSIRQHEVNLDQAVVVLNLTLPYPLNNILLRLVA